MKYHWKANSCSFKMNIHKSKYLLFYYSSSFQKITVTSKFCTIFLFFSYKVPLGGCNEAMNNNFNSNIIAKQDLTKMHTCFKNMTSFNHQFMSDFEWMYNRQKLRQCMMSTSSFFHNFVQI